MRKIALLAAALVLLPFIAGAQVESNTASLMEAMDGVIQTLSCEDLALEVQMKRTSREALAYAKARLKALAASPPDRKAAAEHFEKASEAFDRATDMMKKCTQPPIIETG